MAHDTVLVTGFRDHIDGLFSSEIGKYVDQLNSLTVYFNENFCTVNFGGQRSATRSGHITLRYPGWWAPRAGPNLW